MTPHLFSPAPFEAPAGSLALDTDPKDPVDMPDVTTLEQHRARLAELERKRDRAGVDALTLVELFDLDAARTHVKAAARQRAEAELVILDAFDTERRRLGDDYGNGQRFAELSRRRGEVRELDGDDYPDLDEERLEHLAAAWQRVAAPRIRRLSREDYRRATRGTANTLKAWVAVERAVRALGVEV